MASLHLLRRAVFQMQMLTLRRLATETERDPVVNSRHPNTFGTLSQEAARLQTAQLPDEEGDVETTTFIDGVEGKTRYPVHKYGRIIKKLLEKNNLKEALNILDVKMKEEKVKPDRYTYNLLISGCAAKGYTQKAFKLFNDMKKRDIQFSGSTYTSLVNACANSPFPEDGLKRLDHLRDLMKEKGVFADERICHVMIKAYGRCGELEKAFNVVDEMKDRKLFVSNSTYNFLLQACASNKEAGFRHALIVWRKMLDRKIRPTLYSYNLLLRCTRDCQIGDMETIQEDLKRMISTPSPDPATKRLETPSDPQLLPTHSTETDDETPSNLPAIAALDGSLKLPNLLLPNPRLESLVSLQNVRRPWERLDLIGGCHGFLSTMEASKSVPDIKTFTLLLENLPPTLEAEEELFQSMKNLKIKLDLDFCNLVIKKRAMFYRFEDAKKGLRLIKERQFKPNLMTFGVLALACKGFSDARDLVDDMEKIGYRVNVEILGSLFLRASQNNDLKMMRYVLAKMKQEHIKPNKKLLFHVKTFRSKIDKKLEKSKQGKNFIEQIDVNSFSKDYKELCVILDKLSSSEVEDDSDIHPWDQFKQKKKEMKTQEHL